jgi:hypothetical protein
MRLVLYRKVSSSVIAIDIHLLDPGVDRSMAERGSVSPGAVLDFQCGHQVVGVEILNLSKRFGKNVHAVGLPG